MPILSGLEAHQLIQKRFERLNEKYAQASNEEYKQIDTQNTFRGRTQKVLRPFTCYLTQYNLGDMKKLMTPEEYADCYLEKPLPMKDIIALFRLLNIL
jgi:hypothetical protein